MYVNKNNIWINYLYERRKMQVINRDSKYLMGSFWVDDELSWFLKIFLLSELRLFTDLLVFFNGFIYARSIEIKMGITQDFLKAVDPYLLEFSGSWFLFVSFNWSTFSTSICCKKAFFNFGWILGWEVKIFGSWENAGKNSR